MRRISRINRSIDLLGPKSTRTPSQYLCVTCRHQANTFSTSAPRAKKETFFSTDGLRKRIWGTDQPPGQKDPYTKEDKNAVVEQEGEETAWEGEGSSIIRKPRRGVLLPSGPIQKYKKPKVLFGMEVVGDAVPELREDQSFTAFIPDTIEKDPAVLAVALHRAVVEIFALKQAGVPLDSISKENPSHELDWTMDTTIVPTANGATLTFPEHDTLQSILQELASPLSSSGSAEAAVGPTESQEDVEADRSPVDPLHPAETPAETESQEDIDADKSPIDPLNPTNTPKDRKPQPTESEEDVAADRSEDNPLAKAKMNWDALPINTVVANWGAEWLEVPIEDLEVKFAIIKRTMQLTGARFPDSAIQSAKSIQNLLSHLIKPPKPTKLTEALAQSPELLNLPNVTVSASRVTYHDKERKIGRQKLVRAELMARGLPVFANNGRRVVWKNAPANSQTEAVSK